MLKALWNRFWKKSPKLLPTKQEVAEAKQALRAALTSLQSELGDLDFAEVERENAASGRITIAVKHLSEICVRMDANKNHKRPHVHVDYSTDFHAASYAIDNGDRLAGELKRQYEKAVQRWIGRNRPPLFVLWHSLQDGKLHKEILVKLRGSV
jgi:hypothetical protein